MKDGIRSLDIEPFSDFIDFVGPIHDPTLADDSQILKGNVRLSTTRAIKAKSINVKLKGETTSIQDLYQPDIISPILPKLKTKVKSSVLTAGEHLLPWELEIPNIYPMSFTNKKSIIKYKIQVKVSLGINKTISASRIIYIRRHLLPSQEFATLVGTKAYENTVSNGFYYRIEVPRIVCIEQGYVPILIKYDYKDDSRKRLVENITTNITQIEVYRSRPISNSEADMASMANSNNKKNSTPPSLYELHRTGDNSLSKLMKTIQPITTNTIDKSNEDYSAVPLLLKQEIDSSLDYGFESPLAAISHQLEVLFSFGKQFDEVRAKIPILVSSVPDSESAASKNNHHKLTQKYSIEKELHKLPHSVETSAKKTNESNRTTLDESAISQIKDGLLIQTLKKSASDQDLIKAIGVDEKSIYTRSMTPSPPVPSKLTEIDTKPTELPNSPVSLMSTASLSSQPSDETINSSFNPFVGLHPPPRRTRKKEDNLTLSKEAKINYPYSGPTTPSSPQIKMHPFAPLPPTPDHIPLSPRSRFFLNQSKSSTTHGLYQPTLIKKRSNSIDQSIPSKELDSVTNHYVSAELPPIPPAITRQKLPSVPVEHRKTRMYYDDESDEEEESYDLLFSD